MDRQRFNKILLDPSQIDNNDIRQLNEYRKKYPFFQGLYVVVAKALKEREHPKTDAFIKKAAIYSANRAHLKSIIEGDYSFPEKESKKTLSPVLEKVEKERGKENTTAKEVAKTPEQTPNNNTDTDIKKEPSNIQSDETLAELKATKLRIEALLRGELPEEEEETIPTHTVEEQTKKEVKTPAKKGKKLSQIELIEKFIADDPQIDVKSKIASESGQAQVDLAEKNLKDSNAFLTETYAKLMVNQGKVKKGIEIYKKLSLKFPEKSAYFATQIEKVKSKHHV